VIGRFAGEVLYVGRDLRLMVGRTEQESITLRIEGPTGMVVTDSDLDLAVHLAAVTAEDARMGSGSSLLPRVAREYIVPLGAGVWIGRRVEVTLVDLCAGGDGCRCRPRHCNPKAQIAVEAPRSMAVSRGRAGFSFGDHLRFQKEREIEYGGRG